MAEQKVLVSWSGGKDSALALHELLHSDKYEIAGLLTTVTAGYDRISMHGVRSILLESQADALGFPLQQVLIPQQCTNDEYERLMGEALQDFLDLGITGVMFGDLFLEDVRRYREERLAQVALKGIFPVWGKDTTQAAREFIDLGFRAIVVCVDTDKLPGDFVGREFNNAFLEDLPDQIDPCGENGEFHTFVFDGPLFSQNIEFIKGEKVLREDRFYYCDLLPKFQKEIIKGE